MAKQKIQQVFESMDEAQTAAAERKQRAFKVNGAYVVAKSVAQALRYAYRALVPGIEVVQLDALPSVDAALATLARATPEQKAAARKLLK
jgi:hypothetical protein